MLKIAQCRVIEVEDFGQETVLTVQVIDNQVLKGKVFNTTRENFGYPVDRGEQNLTMVPAEKLTFWESSQIHWDYSKTRVGGIVIALIAGAYDPIILRWTPDFIWFTQKWEAKRRTVDRFFTPRSLQAVR